MIFSRIYHLRVIVNSSNTDGSTDNNGTSSDSRNGQNSGSGTDDNNMKNDFGDLSDSDKSALFGGNSDNNGDKKTPPEKIIDHVRQRS